MILLSAGGFFERAVKIGERVWLRGIRRRGGHEQEAAQTERSEPVWLLGFS